MTENGWPPDTKRHPNVPIPLDQCDQVTIPGTNGLKLWFQRGIPAIILSAFLADLNAYVESAANSRGYADEGSWTPSNSVGTSNHLGGTAFDYNWADHPMGNALAGWGGSDIIHGPEEPAVRDLLSWYTFDGLQMVWWGNDWSSPKDSMHFNMNYGTFEDQDKCWRFIDTHIRADGFSIYRRGGVPRGGGPAAPATPAVLSRADGYAMTIIDVGRQMVITSRGIQIALATGLVESNLKVYANARVPASMSLPHDAVGSDAYSVGIFQQQVRDTGNGWWWGDAATCMDPASSARLFYQRLAKLDYNGRNSPGSYAQDVQDSAYPDRYDQRFAEAVQLYDRLTQLPAPTDPWEVMLMSAPFASASHFRLDDAANLSPVEAIRQNNAMIHEAMVIDAALRGEIWAVQSLAALAGGVLPGSQDTFWKVRAAGLLNAIQAVHPDWIAAATPGKAA